MVPALQGRCTATGLDAATAAERLVAALQARDPGAGRAYWALRAWARLVWQPAYASVLAVELAGGVLPLAGLRWEVDAEEADVTGFALPATAFAATEPTLRRALAAQQLHALAATLLAAVQACVPLHAKAARRLLADCALSALLRAQPLMKLANADLRRSGADWLAQLGASDDSGYLLVDNADGSSRLALDRGICCLDDRREGGELCNTCPRLPRAERLRRLRAEDLRIPA